MSRLCKRHVTAGSRSVSIGSIKIPSFNYESGAQLGRDVSSASICL